MKRLDFDLGGLYRISDSAERLHCATDHCPSLGLHLVCIEFLNIDILTTLESNYIGGEE